MIVAEDEATARLLLAKQIKLAGLKASRNETLEEVDVTVAHAEILLDGDY